ncbi:MFS transporter [Nocardia anaemiae]|uniref:MFS transporter n=1 Tax=Nocardia anaemiae TaxID=263910 RepID=UPI001FDED352|nr:MFS transporter [Nocardia anaemiae]
MVLALVSVSQFMVILDGSIVNIALATIQHDLGFTATGLAWVVDGYLITVAGFMLLAGRATDLFSQRRMLIGGLALFTVSSLTGGLAGAPQILVTARVVQGVGAAMMAPATLAVVNTRFTEKRTRARAFGIWSAAGGVGGMMGALAGGAITTGLSWRWVFLINVPIGAVLIVLASITLSDKQTRRSESLDLSGAITGTAGLAALIYGAMQTADDVWTSPRVLGSIGAGLLLLTVFAVAEARFAAQPLMPSRLLRIRRVAVGVGMLALLGGISIAMWCFTPLFLQNVLGYNALRAGLGQTPAAMTFLIVARAAATLLPRTGPRPLVLTGCGCLLIGFGCLSQADTASGYLFAVLGPTVLVAVGIGLTFPTLMATATVDALDSDAGVVGGLATTGNQVGGSIGLAVLSAAAGTKLARGAGNSISAVATRYDLVFLLAAGLACAIAVASVLLPPDQRNRPLTC